MVGHRHHIFLFGRNSAYSQILRLSMTNDKNRNSGEAWNGQVQNAGVVQQGKLAIQTGKIRSICVYCGSGTGRTKAYAAAARSLGRELARNQIGLVYGGGSLGLMGEVARACR